MSYKMKYNLLADTPGSVLQNHSQIGPIQNDTYTSTTITLTSALRSARAYDLTKLFPQKSIQYSTMASRSDDVRFSVRFFLSNLLALIH